MTPPDAVLDTLERVTGFRPVKAGDGYKARCPYREDRQKTYPNGFAPARTEAIDNSTILGESS